MASLPEVGQVWRKSGPCDWLRVERVLMPGSPSYDGGMPGCIVRVSTGRGGWREQTMFYAASDSWEKDMNESCRFLATGANSQQEWEIKQLRKLPKLKLKEQDHARPS